MGKCCPGDLPEVAPNLDILNPPAVVEGVYRQPDQASELWERSWAWLCWPVPVQLQNFPIQLQTVGTFSSTVNVNYL